MTPSSPSKPQPLQAAKAALDAEDWRIAARTVQPWEAQAILEDLEGRAVPCSAEDAARYAGQLMAFYPARELLDPKTFVAGLAALLATYPLDLVRLIAHPVTGLPSRSKFLPAIAEVREALDLEVARRTRIAANARSVLELAHKRRQEADEEARFAAQRQTPEQRAEAVRRLLRPAVAPSEGEG